MFPMGIVTGNTYIMKPSEKVPMATMRLAELAIEAGVPAGVLQIIHGDGALLMSGRVRMFVREASRHVRLRTAVG